MEQILQLDNVILNWIAEHLHNPFGDAVMPWITALGNVGILWIVTAVILLFLPKWRADAAGFRRRHPDRKRCFKTSYRSDPPL